VEPSDGELMARIATGDGAAFGVVVGRYGDSLVNYLSKLTGCRSRAEDYAQEAFVRLLENARRYDDRGFLSAYLYRIATNLVRSDERRRVRWRGIAAALERSPAATLEAPASKLLSQEASSYVTAAIALLPLRFRAPLVLREIEERSYEEIAAALGCRIGTVKSRIHRAKALLRSRLRGYWQGGSDHESAV
jgi:RNA polymerase sigma-70 factor (ECF subfamily)